ncbi:hypothetical protein BP00DRAFT_495853 [Aspergillus indologenus CBS 114.80]|uniref:Uncharacterized protein n=1 Tax=Aspergillus indologenus CBS 114.80 TaxID=1450541 RepID=A0A2V5I896_9EURO|nr:hypothetical protein BP00DRAFT_495853 [Aspergillus indologenus CBS 114.80]
MLEHAIPRQLDIDNVEQQELNPRRVVGKESIPLNRADNMVTHGKYDAPDKFSYLTSRKFKYEYIGKSAKRPGKHDDQAYQDSATHPRLATKQMKRRTRSIYNDMKVQASPSRLIYTTERSLGLIICKAIGPPGMATSQQFQEFMNVRTNQLAASLMN